MQNVGHKIGGPVEGFMNGIGEVHDARQLGDADEDELGKAVAILVTNKYAPSDNKKLIQYVNLVGYTLVSASKKPDGHYVFGVLDTDDIGAYSGPNGYVMITRGALHSMRDEAELAGVLAHELTHVLDQHGLAAARNAAQKAGYMDATKAVLGSSNATKFIDSGVDAVVRNGYDKPQEDDADAGAVQLLIAAGYDPHSYASYLAHLAALQEAAPQPTTQTSQSAALMKQIMSTHPGIPDRLQAVTKQIADAGATASGGATLKNRFNGMVNQ
ncbi:MAG TPA: M48 family metallopeptidase [Humisphaera sp.]|jgi:predicted Zn-dependent protease|nr:M48 family metallopeptidase [Humisphaera sp.]